MKKSFPEKENKLLLFLLLSSSFKSVSYSENLLLCPGFFCVFEYRLAPFVSFSVFIVLIEFSKKPVEVRSLGVFSEKGAEFLFGGRF
jgi:hypothetical protein